MSTEASGLNDKVDQVVEQVNKVTLPDPKSHSNEKDEAEDSDDEDEAQAQAEGQTGGGGGTNGASKKKKKKKSGAAKRKAKKVGATQTDPPSIGLTKIFLDGCYPVGEEVEHDTSKFLDESRRGETKEESREKERIHQETEGNDYNLIRRASEVHRQVRRYAQKVIKPGMLMIEIAELIEDMVRTLVEENGLEAGLGFPLGLSLNECAAHWQPTTRSEKRVLQPTDVLKIDIGVQVSGRICDSAFTIAFDEDWNPLLDAVRAATNEGIKQAGIDARLEDIGEAIQEVMESHEFEAKGKTHKVKCVRNLNGHSIQRYRIHGGQSIPIVKTKTDERMHEYGYYAIETFGSTGRGYVTNVPNDCSHFSLMNQEAAAHKSLSLASAKKVLHSIKTNFGTLPFSRRYLERAGETNHLLGLKHLVQQGIVRDYPPLSDLDGSMTAQFEHTIMLRPSCKEIVSRGDDY